MPKKTERKTVILYGLEYKGGMTPTTVSYDEAFIGPNDKSEFVDLVNAFNKYMSRKSGRGVNVEGKLELTVTEEDN